MNNKISQNSIYASILFVLWPFLSTFYAVRNYKEAWAKNIIWMFVAFFGYTMVISNEEFDANRYKDQFVEISSTDEESNIVTGLYAEDSGFLDLLKPLLDKLISQFTDDYRVLFLVYGLIFGFFYSRNIWLLLGRLKHPVVGMSILLLIVFSLINPIWYINGFRFWTAAQIFLYGGLLYFLTGRKSGLLLAFLSVFVHFSFMFPAAILFLYLLLGNRLTLYFYFFIASLFISELNIETVRNSVEGILPTVFELKVKNYTNEEYNEQLIENKKNINWYVPLRNKGLKYSIYLFLIVLFWKWRSYILNKKELYGLFCFVLILFGIANIVSSIPSAGRFLTVAFGFSIGFIYLFAQLFKDDLIRLVYRLSIPVLLLYIIVSIRIGFDTIGLTTILGNPLIALLMENDMALIELIK